MSRGDVNTAGTDLAWVGRADGIQIRVRGDRPKGFSLVLLHPERRSSDQSLGDEMNAGPLERRARQSTGSDSDRPLLIGRRRWGADESLRDGEPSYIHNIKQVHVHHTVSSNTYAREDVPALLRGMYAYHTRSLGWSDIGYNFLVDRFGRCWVGRAGGAAKLVRGSHTLGFNAESTGISAIGNYDTTPPSQAMLDGIAAIAAWKLSQFNREPTGEIAVESEGSDKYRPGRRVALPVIDGHRDTNDTTCPGGYLYEALPEVRLRTERIMAAGTQSPSVVVDQPAVVTGLPEVGSTLSVDAGTFDPPHASVTYQWMRDARPIRGARDQTYSVRSRDFASQLSCQVTLSGGGLHPVTQTPSAAGIATAAPALGVTASAKGRVGKIHVIVTPPPGVRVRPTGAVSVTVGRRTKNVVLVGGQAVARFGGHRKLPTDTYAVRVAYDGDIAFTGASHDSSIRIA